MKRILDQINNTGDIKNIDPMMYPLLAQEIREFILEHVSKTGGHLASSLGVVELTMALHLCLNLPEDKLIFDVGHQAYVHKILTGRKTGFDTLRQKDGMCGFPKRKESDCDCFGTGHSSTSLAAAIGFAKARELKGTQETVVAVIGDGALSGGLAYEALNNLTEFKEKKKNFIIILNDNTMSISANVGGMSGYLSDLRSQESYNDFKDNVENYLNHIPGVGSKMAKTLKRSKDSIKQLFVPGMLFENMGIKYYGPVDGNNVNTMVRAINVAKKHRGPILIHAITKKGKGYLPAERNPEKFHGIGPFDLKTGNLAVAKKMPTYTDLFSEALLEVAKQDDKIVAITASMPSGTGLKKFQKTYPDRFFDVGIAEEYAVTFAAGLAAGGMKPVFAVYSSFLQRAYDQVLHDVCIQKLPVVFGIDRSGLVGADGETHQGIFDISYLNHIPNMTIMAPKNGSELQEMVRFAFSYGKPVAIKYPRGSAYNGLSDHLSPLEAGRSEIILKGEKIAILSVGNIMEEVYPLTQLLEESGLHPTLVNVRFVKPYDEELLHELAEKYELLVTVEEGALTGGYGSEVSRFLHKNNYNIDLLNFGIEDSFVAHATVKEQRMEYGIDAQSMADKILEYVSEKER